MSASDADGVVDRDLRVHGAENVFVCSNGVFPNVTAVNPTLTLAALAIEAGRAPCGRRTRVGDIDDDRNLPMATLFC